MMHPYRNEARQSNEARIGRLARADDAEDKQIVKRAIGQHDTQLHGGKKTRLKLATGGPAMQDGSAPKKRLDRKGRGTNVNIIIADKPEPPSPPLPIAPPAAMAPPMPAGGPPPAAPPPGGALPPGSPPAPGAINPMMRQALAARAAGVGAPPGLKTGGVPHMTAGAGSGEGRLEKARLARRSK